MNKNRSYSIVTLLLIFCLSCEVKSQDEPLRVLFVGNSYTYFWNLPQLVASMAASQGQQIITRQSTVGGVNWKQHWEGEKGLKTRKIIEEGGWDIVVLQNHSLSTIKDKDEFMEYGRKFADLVKSIGARPVFYITWARQGNPLMQSQINQVYQRLAEATSCELVPVGPAWMEARQLLPELVLYDPDGSHPAPAGVYLTAALFYQFLTGHSVLDIPPRLTTTDHAGEKIYLAIMPKEEADFILNLVENLDLKPLVSE